MKAERKVLVLLGAIVVAFTLASIMAFVLAPPPVAHQPTQPDPARLDTARLVGQLKGTGLLVSTECDRRRAQVNLRMWLSINADQKESVANLLSTYCRDEGAVGAVHVIDAQSGRELASLTALGGYGVR